MNNKLPKKGNKEKPNLVIYLLPQMIKRSIYLKKVSSGFLKIMTLNVHKNTTSGHLTIKLKCRFFLRNQVLHQENHLL
jgi:hypothetical protein